MIIAAMEKALEFISSVKVHPSQIASRDALHDALSAAIKAAEKQEPVAWRYKGKLHKFDPSDWASPEFPITPLYATPPAQRQWVGLTDEERDSLIPDPDGSAEANVRSVEILPGAWGKEYEEVDAWSEPLVLQMLRDHEAKLKKKNT